MGVALAFILIPWLNSIRISFAYGNFLSFKIWGLPLADPLAVLQITLKNHYLSLDLIIGAGIALVLAATLGTVFCSWVCPFGLLSELIHRLANKAMPRDRRKVAPATAGQLLCKPVIFVLGLLGFMLFSYTPVLNQLSLPAWYSRIFQFIFVQGHVSLVIVFFGGLLLLEFLTRRRLWCRYLCPQSVLLMLAKQANRSRLRVGYEPARCLCRAGKDPCASSCSLGLNPKKLPGRLETECNNCGDCVVACRQRGGALQLGFRPAPSLEGQDGNKAEQGRLKQTRPL
jgi:ferredoxin-type protein NapH